MTLGFLQVATLVSVTIHLMKGNRAIKINRRLKYTDLGEDLGLTINRNNVCSHLCGGIHRYTHTLLLYIKGINQLVLLTWNQ